jgi:two-component system, NarL family, invasion response regulator UvrY
MKVLIVDDHPVVRMGIKQILADEPDIATTMEATSVSEMMEYVRQEDWSVIVLDITLPDRSGLEALKDVKAMRPELPVLILSMHPEDQYAVRVLKAGASGYVTKESAADELAKALRKVVSGGRYISSTLAEKLAIAVGGDYDKQPHETLSDREFQVMFLIASGKKPAEIADELLLSVKTVSTYRTRVLEKMHMANNAELTYYAVKNNLIE